MSNPFDPMGGGGQQSDPWGSPAPKDSISVASGHSSSYNASSSVAGPPPNVYPPQQQQQQPPNMGSPPYGANPYGAPHPQYSNASPYDAAAASSNPYGAPQPNGSTNAVVVSGSQSNPYAMQSAAYGQPQPQQQQQLVTSAYQSNPYAMPAPAAPGGSSSGANPFDPFATAPAPAPVPQTQAMETYQPPQMDVYAPPPPSQQPQLMEVPQEQQMEAPHEQQMEPFESTQAAAAPPASIDTSTSDGDFVNGPPKDSPEIQEAPDMLESPEGTTYPPQLQFGQKGVNNEPDPDPTDNVSPRNPYATELARQAPPGSSPLPKAELVQRKGFVLSRISFRTIVMKKWKQTFWVQYGPHTMLWFRSQADFDDWLNNPYLMQNERNFLIKLAVNFVHDLYKPNVRGYQVTQCRTKGYGNKMVRQFKLERWMDYGPTIAAAFGSYNPAEVDALREAIVQCMRNTPLNGGIRATGAVRQREPEHHERRDSDEYHQHQEHKTDNESSGVARAAATRMTSYDELPPDNEPPPKEAESVAEEADLLDVNNWDDVPVEPQQPPQQQMQPYGAPYGSPPPQQQMQHQQQQQQQQQQQPPNAYGQNPYGLPQQQQPDNPYGSPAGHSNAMVPVSNGTPQAYPGAPPPSQQYQQYPPQQQPGYPQQSPYGSPPTTQQASPYGSPPPQQQQYQQQY